ncbi:hypothetical protein HNQ92_005583 [Rhabdobacter roseus]|uniref:Uncharacterized protein n=1 Tax=Rhabdobacter roseus TaxID=1655419 RepID=A0A840U5S0_9BACT|nr:hypothetical protein [Rhabdobacter roseus]MBB5287420.1 hypothetical protein [Rhabdobacter roseus]
MQTPSTSQVPARKRYRRPQLRKQGTLARLTLKSGSQSDAFSPYSQ